MLNDLLIIDDDPSVLEALTLTLEGHHSIRIAKNGADALKLVAEQPPNVILLDIGLPGMSGFEVLEQVRKTEPDINVIMVTATEETRTVVKALRLGAHDYLVKPIDAQELKLSVKNAMENWNLKDKIRRIQQPKVEQYRLELIGRSAPIKSMLETARKLGPFIDTPVLITGETGTGKGVLARAIHFSFSELPGPFVPVNCTAITHDLFESELFGYDRGAFTGARSEGRPGYFEQASGGTIFLDEIGSISLAMQSKLLGVLEERAFQRVGGSKPRQVSARVIAATNTDLQAAMEAGLFRDDLFFRLNVVKIHMPPLRECADDIIPLAEHFIKMFNAKYSKKFVRIHPEAGRALLRYPWPGNVRELRNTLERIVLLESETTLLPSHLAALRAKPEETKPAKPDPADSLVSYEETIKGLILETLHKTAGNVLEASRLLEMPPYKLRYRIKKYGLTAM